MTIQKGVYILLISCRNKQEMKKENNSDASSENDKTFNFNYEIDISQKKDKTVDGFKDEGYEFDAFPDFKDDKTNKSQKASNKKLLPSEILKKSEDSYIIHDNIEVSYGKYKGGSVIEDFPHLSETTEKGHFKSAYTSPKFNQNMQSYGTISHQENSKKEAYPLTLQSMFSKESNIGKGFQKKSAFIEEEPVQYTTEDEYNEMVNLIRHYEEENAKLDYECGKLTSNIEYIKKQIENPSFDYQLGKLADETHQINENIEEQRSIQRCLANTSKQLEEDFQKLILSIQKMEFKRPQVIKDQSKAIIDEINALKSQFQSVKRDEGSLNLSSTLQQPPTVPLSAENRFQSGEIHIPSPEQKLFDQLVTEIRLAEQQSTDPKYLYNIKMGCVKEEWTLYNSGEFCVQVCYRKFPVVEVRLGNKTIKDFDKFLLKQKNKVILENEILAGKSFYLHQFTIGKECPPFLKLQLQHKFSVKPLLLFVPTLSLQMGEFIPITTKEYYHQVKYHSDTLEETITAESPIDKLIIRQIEECCIYFPNLLKEEGSCKGIFRFHNSSEGSLVSISQNGELVWFEVKNNIGNLCKALQFLFTN